MKFELKVYLIYINKSGSPTVLLNAKLKNGCNNLICLGIDSLQILVSIEI